MEGRATNSNPLRLKVREQIEGEGLSGLVEVFHEERASTACAVRPMGRDRLAQGLISIRLDESGNGEAEAHRLADSDENREGPCTVVDEAYKRQVEEVTGTLSEGPKKGFYKSRLD